MFFERRRSPQDALLATRARLRGSVADPRRSVDGGHPAAGSGRRRRADSRRSAVAQTVPAGVGRSHRGRGASASPEETGTFRSDKRRQQLSVSARGADGTRRQVDRSTSGDGPANTTAPLMPRRARGSSYTGVDRRRAREAPLARHPQCHVPPAGPSPFAQAR